MKVTDAFRGEHAALYAQFDRVEKLASSLELAELKQLVGTVEATLGTHATLEDELLFDALEAHLGTGPGPLYVMRREHERVEAELARVAAATELDDARAGAAELTRVARCHFGKEEQVLFPMALELLGEQRIKELGTVWAERRGVILA